MPNNTTTKQSKYCASFDAIIWIICKMIITCIVTVTIVKLNIFITITDYYTNPGLEFFMQCPFTHPSLSIKIVPNFEPNQIRNIHLNLRQNQFLYKNLNLRQNQLLYKYRLH